MVIGELGCGLIDEGNHVNHKRIYRIMQKYGLFSEGASETKVPTNVGSAASIPESTQS